MPLEWDDARFLGAGKVRLSARFSRVRCGDVAGSRADRGGSRPEWMCEMTPSWRFRNQNSAPRSPQTVARGAWDQCAAVDRADDVWRGRCAGGGVVLRLPHRGSQLQAGRGVRETSPVLQDALHCKVPSPSLRLLCRGVIPDHASGDSRSST